jgi:ComF family protein
MRDLAGQVKDAALNLIFPPVCPVCGKPAPARAYLHPECERKLVPVSGERCAVCGKQLPDGRESLCLDCRRRRHEFIQTISVFQYTEAARQCIYRFKYKNKREYAAPLGYLMWKYAGRRIRFYRPEVIIPVPMYAAKKRRRGYNQSELLAQSLARVSGIPCAPEALIRTRATRPMKELTAGERAANLSGAFLADGPLPWKRVLLLDDIYTSGSTLDACAAALKKGGAREVYGICLCTGEGF